MEPTTEVVTARPAPALAAFIDGYVGYRIWMTLGAEIVRGLRDEDYGSRGFTVRDPEGNLWSFGTYWGQ